MTHWHNGSCCHNSNGWPSPALTEMTNYKPNKQFTNPQFELSNKDPLTGRPGANNPFCVETVREKMSLLLTSLYPLSMLSISHTPPYISNGEYFPYPPHIFATPQTVPLTLSHLISRLHMNWQYLLHCLVHSLQWTLYTVHCMVCNAQLQCTVSNIQYTVYSFQCTVYRV